MTIFTIILSFIVPVVAFFFECYPRFLNRKIGVDIWTHLLYLKEYVRQKGIPQKISNGFLVEGEYDYPPMFITILSKFPIRLVEKYEFLFSPFFDSLHLLLIFYLTYYLTGSFVVAFFTQFFYILTPIIIIENSSATPRSLGYMLFTLLFFSLFFYTATGAIYFFLLAVVFGSLIFLSHRFTTQGFLFFTVFFSIMDRSWVYVLAFGFSFLGALLLSKGFYLKVLKGHLGNLRFWRKNIQYRFYHQVKGDYKTHRSTDFVFRVYNQFISIPPVVLGVTNPWILFAFISLFFLTFEGIYIQLFLWVGFSYVLALITIWVKPLRFLGEGQRYLELSAFPSAFFAAQLLHEVVKGTWGWVWIVAYIAVGLASLTTIIVIQRKAIIKDTLRTLTPELSQMYHYLKTLKRKPRLLCIPHQITTNTIYHTGCSVFVNADYKDIEKISDVYPYLRLPISQILNKYSLDGILINEEYATIADLKIKKYKELKRYGSIVYVKLLT